MRGLKLPEFRRPGEIESPLAIDIPEEGVGRGESAGRLKAVEVLGPERPVIAPVQKSFGFGRRHFPGDSNNGGRRDIADLFRPLRGIVDDFVVKLLKAYGLFLDKIRVIKFLFDHYIDHGEKKSQVGSGFYGQPFIRENGGFAVAGVDDHDLGASFFGLDDILDLAQIDPSRRVAADDQNILGVGKIIGGKGPGGEIPTGISGRITGGSMGKVMGAAQGMHESQGIGMV